MSGGSDAMSPQYNHMCTALHARQLCIPATARSGAPFSRLREACLPFSRAREACLPFSRLREKVPAGRMRAGQAQCCAWIASLSAKIRPASRHFSPGALPGSGF